MFDNVPFVKGLRYSIPQLFTATVSFIILIIVFNYSKQSVNITVEIIQLVCAVVSLITMIDCIRKDKDSLLSKIIAQAISCFILGELYWILHIYIKGFEQVGAFSISDLSWIGFYIFLLSACRGVFVRVIDFKDRKYTKINIVSFIAPIIIVGLNAALFLLGDNLFYTLIYCVPTAFLSYYTLRYILASFGGNEILRGFRAYHITVGLILIIDHLTCLVLDYGLENTVYIFKFCFALMLLTITPTVNKGVREWHR